MKLELKNHIIFAIRLCSQLFFTVFDCQRTKLKLNLSTKQQLFISLVPEFEVDVDLAVLHELYKNTKQIMIVLIKITHQIYNFKYYDQIPPKAFICNKLAKKSFSYGRWTHGHFQQMTFHRNALAKMFHQEQKKYLSVCEESEEEISKTKMYKGVIMGEYHRLFVSIPTKHPNSNKFYNIHYLFDTGSPITTLTRRALCALHQKECKADSQYLLDEPYQIGSQMLQIQCSNPDKQSRSRPYHNVNVLGMNFLRKFQQVNLYKNMRHLKFNLELSKQNEQNWDKNRL